MLQLIPRASESLPACITNKRAFTAVDQLMLFQVCSQFELYLTYLAFIRVVPCVYANVIIQGIASLSGSSDRYTAFLCDASDGALLDFV